MKIIFLSTGVLSLGIGIIGIVLPILPTTPFLILTGFLFAKGSSRYHDWFTETKLYKKYIADFIENRQMSRRKKWTLLILVDLMLLITFISIASLYLRVLILVLVLVKHWYFYKFVDIT